MIVQEFPFGSVPDRPLANYSIDDLLDGKHTESVYIACNITEPELESGFLLSSNKTVDERRRLRPGYSYNIRLMFRYDGTDTVIFVDPKNLPISKLYTLSVY